MPLRNVLAVPAAYRVFGYLIGAVPGREAFVRDHVRVKPGQRVLDIGCGPADIVPHLPDVDYVGVDASAEYIATATRNYGRRGTFRCGRVEELIEGADRGFDVVLAIGLAHHLDDVEAEKLYRVARSALVPGGRLVTLDPAYREGQSRAARFLLDRDRGEHVRKVGEYEVLARRVFGQVTSTIREDLLRIPYTIVVLECSA